MVFLMKLIKLNNMKFKLSDKEIENYKNFQDKMDMKYSNDEQYCGAVGGFYKLSFIPTGLGNIVIVNTIKGDEEDITDYDLF